MPIFFDQSEYDIRFEWGLDGAKRLSQVADVTIIVDVLSFSTCVDIATANGAWVYPFLYKDDRAKAYADEVGAFCAGPQRSKGELCLSPRTLKHLKAGEKVVLPSPNGSTIAFSIESPNILCGCIRNASAIAKMAATLGKNILIIAAGEQWKDGGLRPALEDMLGAGAILSYLPGTKSPEAIWAAQSFRNFSSELLEAMRNCSSGRELIERGFPEDIEDAAALDVSQVTPILRNKYFVNGNWK